VYCQLDTLKKCINRASVRKTLESLPKTLDQTYERIILSIQEEYRQQAIIALHWLSYTRRPLKLFELAEVVAVDTSEDDYYPFNPQGRLFRPDLILEICSSLVSASGTEQSADVRLAHFSVQEYLLSDRIQKSPAAAFSVTLARGNAIMASFCVSYMLGMRHDRELRQEQPPLDEYAGGAEQEPPDYSTEALMQDDPLVRYVVEYWYQHANSITQHRPELSTMILQLLSHNAEGFSMVDWWNLAATFRIGLWYELSDIHLLGGSIGVAAYLGLVPEVKLLLELDLGANSRLERMGIALQAAAYGGHLDIVELILHKGADPNSTGGLFGTSLQAAAHKGSKAIARILLENGAKLNVEGGKHGTALQAAVSTGNREVAELLLQSGADPNVGIGVGPHGSALQASAYRVDPQMMTLLLEKGAHINAVGGKYGTALQAAAYRSAKDLVKLLLERGADPNVEGGEYGSALQAATHWGNTEIIKLLLDYGANPNASSGKYLYGTALQAAANWGTKDIVELLLERGADPNIEAGHYGSALDAAVNRADGDICEILLDKGAKIELEDREYKDLVHSAGQRRGSKEVAEILIHKNADQNAEFGCYGKAVQLAALKGYKEGVKLSNESGGLPKGLSARHYSTLKLAENLDRILKVGDVSKVNYSSQFSTLHWAAWNNHPEVVKFIAQEEAQNRTESRMAAERPSLKGTFSSKSFSNPSAGLSKIEDPFDTASFITVDDWSPLHVAIFRSNISAVKALTDPNHPLDFGGDPELRVSTREILEDVNYKEEAITVKTLADSLGWTHIHIAALLEKKSVLEQFLSSTAEVDISTPDMNGMTALHWVAAAGRKDMVQFLLSMDADSDVKDRWRRTAADLAAGKSRLSILHLLTGDKSDQFPAKTILSNGINCACWRTCDSCDSTFRHMDLFLRK
jgi:ankyrin repeat protein